MWANSPVTHRSERQRRRGHFLPMLAGLTAVGLGSRVRHWPSREYPPRFLLGKTRGNRLIGRNNHYPGVKIHQPACTKPQVSSFKWQVIFIFSFSLSGSSFFIFIFFIIIFSSFSLQPHKLETNFWPKAHDEAFSWCLELGFEKAASVYCNPPESRKLRYVSVLI